MNDHGRKMARKKSAACGYENGGKVKGEAEQLGDLQSGRMEGARTLDDELNNLKPDTPATARSQSNIERLRPTTTTVSTPKPDDRATPVRKPAPRPNYSLTQ